MVWCGVWVTGVLLLCVWLGAQSSSISRLAGCWPNTQLSTLATLCRVRHRSLS